MPVEYSYPNPPAGYHFTMLTRIENEVGVAPTGMQSSSDGITKISFESALTTQQETDLNTLMAGDPQNPPAPAGTVIVLDDVWENRTRDYGATGLTWQIYFTESTPGSGFRDRIELHFNQTLTNPQKNAVITYLKDLIREA